MSSESFFGHIIYLIHNTINRSDNVYVFLALIFITVSPIWFRLHASKDDSTSDSLSTSLLKNNDCSIHRIDALIEDFKIDINRLKTRNGIIDIIIIISMLFFVLANRFGINHDEIWKGFYVSDLEFNTLISHNTVSNLQFWHHVFTDDKLSIIRDGKTHFESIKTIENNNRKLEINEHAPDFAEEYFMFFTLLILSVTIIFRHASKEKNYKISRLALSSALKIKRDIEELESLLDTFRRKNSLRKKDNE